MAEKRGHIKDTNGNIKFHRVVIFGGLSGGLGQFLASPFFLLKTHFQSKATSSIAVGYQHHHEGLWMGLRKIYETHGIRGLYRGATFSIPRATVGSVTQLSSFEYAKQHLLKYDYFKENSLATSFLGSMVGGVVISIVMTPFDLIMVRNYNQPTDARGKGLMYTSYMNCVMKIYETEGLSAFYKGFGPMYFRLGPHTVLSLVFWDQLKSLHEKFIAESEP
nr:solute carrier family 25 member 35-like [Leptinotarsa decemlineata]